MKDQAPTHATAGQPIGFLVRHQDLVLVVKINTNQLECQLTPQAALELARDLLVAGMDHAEARAIQRVNADATAAGAIGKASSH